MRFTEYHDEVLTSLMAIGREQLAQAAARDRRSELVYAGVTVPERRKLSRTGFSFYDQSDHRILAIWDDLFMYSNNGDVLFCALDYLRLRVRQHAPPYLWPTIKNWVQRVENWAHADDMSWVFSYVLEANLEQVFPTLQEWNLAQELWPKRISIVSLIHYTGKNSAFLPPEVVLPMVERCVGDHRRYMQLAAGWVLREMSRKYPDAIVSFLTEHLTRIGSVALTRATARMGKSHQRAWRERRKRAIS